MRPCGVITEARLMLPKPLIYRDGIQLRLACVRGGDGPSNREQQHDRSQGLRFVGGTFALWTDSRWGSPFAEIPVFFKIPGDAIPLPRRERRTGGSSGGLTREAKTQGIHFAVSFVVPVSAAHGPPATIFPADPTAGFRSPEPARYQPMDHRIIITPLAGGGNRYEFLAGRGVAVAALLIAIGLFFAGVGVVFIVTSGFIHVRRAWILQSRSFPCSWGLWPVRLARMPVALGIYLLLQKTTVTARHGLITVETCVVAFTRRRELRAADIQGRYRRRYLQLHQCDHPIYAVCRLRTVRQQTAATMRRASQIKRDAEWLDGQFKQDVFGAGH